MSKYRRRRTAAGSQSRHRGRGTLKKILQITGYALASVAIIGALGAAFVPRSEADETTPTVSGSTSVIPEGYLLPTGTLSITENGLYNIAEYENVTVDVPVTDSSGAACSSEHIIYVDELPTENIDESAMYALNSYSYTFAIYLSAETAGAAEDVICPDYFSLVSNDSVDLSVISELPSEGALPQGVYFVEKNNEVYVSDGTSVITCAAFCAAQGMEYSLSFKGFVDSEDSLNEEGYYFLQHTSTVFYRWSSANYGFTDLWFDFGYGQGLSSYCALCESLGVSVSCHYLETVPESYTFLPTGDGYIHLYYIESENAVFTFDSSGDIEITISDCEIVSSVAYVADSDSNYVVVLSDGWTEYGVSNKRLEIKENGVYDCSNALVVSVDVPSDFCQSKWEFKPSLTEVSRDMTIYVNFTSAGVAYTGISFDLDDVLLIITYLKEDGTQVEAYRGWYDEYYITNGNYVDWYLSDAWNIDFGSDIQIVSSEFKEWLTDNATPMYAVVELITFTIDGTSYQAVEGMTWEQWTASDYNTDGYKSDSGGSVFTSDQYAISDVVTTDTIVSGEAYALSTIQTGGAD